MIQKLFFLFSLFLISFNSIYSQKNTPSYSIESGAVISTGKHAPFWFYSNQYGKISPNNNCIYILPSIYRNLKDNSKFDYSYTLSPLLRYDGLGRSYMHQWYGEIKYRFLHFTAGAKEEFFGNQDSSLSTGFILWSKNARPMPKLTLNVPNYTPVPFTKKYLEFKGGMSHGWFDDNEYNKNVYLHHKYAYVRLGGKLPVHISYGLHHFAQWGGELDGIKLPSSINDFKRVFLAQGGGSNSPGNEYLNKLGNHLGSENLGLEVETKQWKISLYQQTIFEDGSGFAHRNINDGLFGIAIHSKDKRKFIHGIVYEFMQTTNQSGRINETDSIKPNGQRYEVGGNDNYFNNGIYIEGWTFHEMTIGTPFITSPALLHGDRYDYNRNNRILAHHVGVQGVITSFIYEFHYTYSTNYGTNFYPMSPSQSQHSLFLKITKSNDLPWNIALSFSLGADFGKLYGNNVGLSVTLIKTSML